MQQSWDDDKRQSTDPSELPDSNNESLGDFEQGKTDLMLQRPPSQSVNEPVPGQLPAGAPASHAMPPKGAVLPLAALMAETMPPMPPPRPPALPPPLEVSELPPQQAVQEASIFFDTSSPALPLPDFQHLTQEKPLTLLPNRAEALLDADKVAGAKWPYVLMAIILVGLLGAAAQYQALLSWLMPPPPQTASLPAGPSPQQRAKALYAAAAAAYEQKQYNAAITSFQEALLQDPNYAPIHRGLGIVYAVEKRQPEALQHYRRYLELAPQAEDAEQVRQIVKEGAMALGKEEQNKQEASPAPSEKQLNDKKGDDKKKGKASKGKGRGKRNKP